MHVWAVLSKKKHAFIGEVFLEKDNTFNFNKMPFKDTEVKVGRLKYIAKILAYCDCESFAMFVIELHHTSETLFLVYRFTRAGILNEEYDSQIDENPKRLFDLFMSDLVRYTNKKGGYDYVRMFAEFTSKERT